MSLPPIQFTNAGLSELISSKNQGLKGAIKWMSTGDRSYTPSFDQTALKHERQRKEILDWEDISSTQLRLAALFDGDLEYEVREIGLWLESGTLLGVISAPNKRITFKSEEGGWLARFTIDISPLPARSITVVVGNNNINLLMAEELMTSAIATVSLGATQIKIAHQQLLLSEKLRTELNK